MPFGQFFQNSSNNSFADKALPISYCLLAPNQSTSWYVWSPSGVRLITAALIIYYGIVRRFFPLTNPNRQQPTFFRCLLYMACFQNRPPAVSRRELFILILISIFIQHCMNLQQMYRVSLHTVIGRPRHHVERFRTLGDVLAANLRIKVHRSLQLTPAQEAIVGSESEVFYELDFRTTDSAYLLRCEDARRLALSRANYNVETEQLWLTVVWQPVFTGIRAVTERELQLFEAGLLEDISGKAIHVKTEPYQTKLQLQQSGLDNYIKFIFIWLFYVSVAVIVFVLECCMGRINWQWKDLRWRTNRRVTPPRLVRSKSEPCLGGRACSWPGEATRRYSTA